MRIAACLALLFAMIIAPVHASTLGEIQKRDKLLCGVNTGLPGFAALGPDSKWAGFDVDFCKALAAATLSSPDKVEYVPLTTQNRFDALKSGAVDVLARNTTWTMERETKWPFLFAGVSYHDGQGFMLNKLMGVTSVFNMSQVAICFVKGTTTQANVDDFFKERDMAYTAASFDTAAEALTAYKDGKCDAYTADQSQLYSLRQQLPVPDEHIVLPEVISKEPLGPVVRSDDAQWFNIVRWCLFALVNAEELDIRAANLADGSKSAAARRLIGSEGSFGADLGLANDWAAKMVKSTGNYSEIFDRNLGQGSKLAIERGLNALWSKGGVLYAPPVR